ncbi:MAG: hypothetical protein H7Z11_20735 [Verrucomicrobia bacterium]|nr:hypothetical protein [Leptolyngbya sp. ES-bin-22]
MPFPVQVKTLVKPILNAVKRAKSKDGFYPDVEPPQKRLYFFGQCSVGAMYQLRYSCRHEA